MSIHLPVVQKNNIRIISVNQWLRLQIIQNCSQVQNYNYYTKLIHFEFSTKLSIFAEFS